MKKIQKGSFTVEAAVVVPLLLFAIGIIMTLLFYCHDKNVLAGVVSEAALIEAGRSEREDYEGLVEDALFWFEGPRIEVTENGGTIVVIATAERGGICIREEAMVTITTPEKFIRNVRKIESIVGGENEDLLSDGFE